MIKPIILVNDSDQNIELPFVIGTVRNIDDGLSNDYNYIFYKAGLIPDEYEIDFTDNKLSKNLFWARNEKEIKKVIVDDIYNFYRKPEVLCGDIVINSAFIYKDGDNNWLIDEQGQYFYFNSVILANLGFKIHFNSKVLFDDIKPYLAFKGALGKNHSFSEYKTFINGNYFQYQFLLFMKYIYETGQENDVILYKNILDVENYFNEIDYIDYIDLNRAEDYGLEYESMEFKYNHSGFENRTGRIFQSSNTNFLIQNLKKSHRDIIVAKENQVLVEIDFNSFEYFILQQVLGKKPDFDKDPHIETYNNMIGLDLGDRKKERELGKKINYGLIYGANVNNLYAMVIDEIKEAGLSLNKSIFAEKVNSDLLNELKPLTLALEEEWEKDLVIENYFGRKIKSEKKHALINYYIQSTAVDIFNYKILEVLKLFNNKEENLILIQKFDSLLFALNKKDVKEGLLNNIVKLLYEPVGNIKVRFNVTYGKNWRDMK